MMAEMGRGAICRRQHRRRGHVPWDIGGAYCPQQLRARGQESAVSMLWRAGEVLWFEVDGAIRSG